MGDLDLILKSTVQGVFLSVLSNVLAQLITSYQNNLPYGLDMTQIARFATFSIISGPPNVLWQIWLEGRFPGYHEDESAAATAPAKTGKASKAAVQPQRKLDKRNTAIKIALDQTFGALFNTVAFLVAMPLLRGETDWAAIWAAVWSETLPLIRAGQTLWPAVSVISFTLVPLEWRTGFGGLAGVLWGIYLSLVEGRRGKVE